MDHILLKRRPQEQEGSLFHQMRQCVRKFNLESACVLQLLNSIQHKLKKPQQTIPTGLIPHLFLYCSRLEGLDIRRSGGQENTAPGASLDTQVVSCS